MAFMLGSFTSGLFGGARDAFQLVNDWNTLNTQRHTREAAAAVKDALGTAGTGSEKLPSVTTTSPPAADKPLPDVSSMPPPKFMRSVLPSTEAPRQRKPEAPSQKLAATQQAAPNYLAPGAIPTATAAIPPGAGAAIPPGASAAIPPVPQGMPTVPFAQAMRQPGAPVPPGNAGAPTPALVGGALPGVSPAAPSIGQAILNALTPYVTPSARAAIPPGAGAPLPPVE